jgi:hypothetical protein
MTDRTISSEDDLTKMLRRQSGGAGLSPSSIRDFARAPASGTKVLARLCRACHGARIRLATPDLLLVSSQLNRPFEGGFF